MINILRDNPYEISLPGNQNYMIVASSVGYPSKSYTDIAVSENLTTIRAIDIDMGQ